jgi:hypothetical protein
MPGAQLRTVKLLALALAAVAGLWSLGLTTGLAAATPPTLAVVQMTAFYRGQPLSIARSTDLVAGVRSRLEVSVSIPKRQRVLALTFGVSPTGDSPSTTDLHLLRAQKVQVLMQTRGALEGRRTFKLSWVPMQTGRKWLVAIYVTRTANSRVTVSEPLAELWMRPSVELSDTWGLE